MITALMITMSFVGASSMSATAPNATIGQETRHQETRGQETRHQQTRRQETRHQETMGETRHQETRGQYSTPVASSRFMLSSPQVEPDGEIDASFEYNGFGCSGDNRSPELQWHNPPPNTRSFAISVHDPDAPTGSGWWHWRVVNIPASATGLPVNAGAEDSNLLPEGSHQIRNDFGYKGWGGMCPPQGAAPHRYTFTVHALDVERLDLPEDASPALAGFMIHQHEIERAGFMVTYARE